MKNLIRKLAWWMLGKTGPIQIQYEYGLPDVDDVLLEAAKKAIEGPWAAEHSGEYKRHQVYAKLIKQFPEAPKRHVALAIEIAVCSTEQ